jgi:hypothetical protein
MLMATHLLPTEPTFIRYGLTVAPVPHHAGPSELPGQFWSLPFSQAKVAVLSKFDTSFAAIQNFLARSYNGSVKSIFDLILKALHIAQEISGATLRLNFCLSLIVQCTLTNWLKQL